MASPREPVEHLYIHIPFCPAKCAYCAFVTRIGSLKLLPAYVEALGTELAGLATLRPAAPLRTVYFGGGTPSLLLPAQVGVLLDTVDRLFGISSDAEITLEAHPATVRLAKLRGFRAAGVTRLSVGGEALDDAVLAATGRTHTARDVLNTLRAARRAGFASLALDLMYGLPGQGGQAWKRTLDLAAGAGMDHLSLYPLAVEAGTPLALQRRRGGLELPADEEVAGMHQLACDLLRLHGYEHYEIANWARPGHRCRHNLACWSGREHFAAGVGAHGYLRPLRTENIRHVTHYIEAMRRRGPTVARAEYLDANALLAETIFLRLRLLTDGLDLDWLRDRFGFDLASELCEMVDALTTAGLIRVDGSRLVLAEAAAPVANEVWARLTSAEPTIANVM